MARSTAVEAPAHTAVPDLAPTPASEQIGLDDIALPTLYVGNALSKAVAKRLVGFGDLYVAFGSDDPEPTVVRELSSTDEGVLIVPLHMHKTWTYSDGDRLDSWPYTEDGQPPADAPEGVFRTYNYVVLVPSFDPELPVNLRLNSKSQRPAANKMNMTVSRGDGFGKHAFRISSATRPRGNSEYAVPVVTEAELDTPTAEQAASLQALILPGLRAKATTTAVPAI